LRYIFTCKSDYRTVGCCSNIVTVIYYLAFALYKRKLTFPANHLDLIFINTENKKPPYKPFYVKSKKFKIDNDENDEDDDDKDDKENDDLDKAFDVTALTKWGMQIT